MVEGGEHTTTLPKNPEFSSSVIQVHMVTGDHAVSDSQYAAIKERQDKGDLTANIWIDKNIGDTLRKLQPHVLSIDSMPVSRNLNSAVKRYILSLTPINPADFGSEKSIYLVGGDPANYWRGAVEDSITPEFDASPEKLEEALQMLDENRKNIDDVTLPEVKKRNDVKDIAPALVASLAVGMSTYFVGLHEAKKNKTFHNISRRQALGKIGGLLGLAVAATAASMAATVKFAPKVGIKSEPGESMIDGLLNTIARKVVNIDYSVANGRTAILIQKGIAAAEILGEDEVAVVAGTAHGHDSKLLVSDQDARDLAIREYTRLLLGVVDEVAKFAGMNEEKTQKAKVALLNSLIDGQILIVNSLSTQVPPNEIEIDDAADVALRFKQDFKSPGMKRALGPLIDSLASPA